MASRPDPFVDHCLELLGPLGPVVARRMFGGWGLKLGDAPLGLIADGRLYLKVDAETEATWKQADCAPFTFEARGTVVEMSYREPPEDAMESTAAMATWARLALAAGLRAAQKKQATAARRAAPRKRAATPATARKPPAPKTAKG